MSQSKPIRPEWHEIIEEKEIGNLRRLGTGFRLKWDKRLNEEAGCRGLDVELFYPERDVFTADEERMFQRMCIECPVMLMCLEWGIAHERYGVWGGTTPAMRHRERKRRGWVATDPNRKIQ